MKKEVLTSNSGMGNNMNDNSKQGGKPGVNRMVVGN